MTAPKPIVAPGPTPKGPPGWEEKQQQRLSSGQLTNEKQSSNYHDDAVIPESGGDLGYETVNHDPADTISTTTNNEQHHEHHKSTVKEKLHHLGEKLAIVPPQEKDEHGNPLELSAHRQDGSTMPE